MKVGVLCFSPTGGTRTICMEIARAIGDPVLLDLTLPDGRFAILGDPETIVQGFDHIVAGVPVYSGKIPGLTLEAFKAVRGHGVRATAVVTYGNREFGVALRSLSEILEGNDFRLVSAGAFVAEHSYSNVVPVAVGRPDGKDLTAARAFGVQSSLVSGILFSGHVGEQLDRMSTSPNSRKLTPAFHEDNCGGCGQCGEACPAGLIQKESGQWLATESRKQCTGCMACTRVCTNDARVAAPNLLERAALKTLLKNAARVRREPSVFLSDA